MLRTLLNCFHYFVEKILLKRLQDLEHSYLKLFELANTLAGCVSHDNADDFAEVARLLMRYKIELSGVRVLMEKTNSMTYRSMRELFFNIDEQIALNLGKEKQIIDLISELSNPRNIPSNAVPPNDTWVQ